MAAAISPWRSIPNAGSELRWYQNKGTLKLNLLLCVVYAAQSLNGFDGNLISGFQAYPSWLATLGQPSDSAIGLLNVGFYVSGLLSAPFTSYAADKYGRRCVIIYAAICNLIGTMFGCLADVGNSNGYGMFLTSRIFCGSGFSAAILVCPILLHETPHPRDRATMAGFFDCSYSIGSLVASWVLFGCSYIDSNWSWRIPYLLHLPLATVMIVAINFIPESPRWLIKKGRDAEALAFMTMYHANGVENDPLVLYQYQEIHDALEMEDTIQQASWMSMITHRGNRRRIAAVLVMALAANLSGSAVIQYYYTGILKLVGITNETVQTAIGAGKTTFGFAMAVLGLICTHYIRRRTHMWITWIGLIISNVCLVATCAVYAQSPVGDKNLGAGKAAVVFVWVYSAFNNFASGPIFYVYPAEVLHYSIRARGQTVWTIVSKILSIYNAYVNSIGTGALGWKFFLVYTAFLLVIGVLLYFFMAETKGRTLEEISEAFDGLKMRDHALETALPIADKSQKAGSSDVNVVEVDEKFA